MKKILPILFAIPTLLLTSCNNGEIDKSKIALDYGTIRANEPDYIDAIPDLKLKNSNELYNLIQTKVNFILIVYNEGCGCFDGLNQNAAKFLNEYHVDFRVIDCMEISSDSRFRNIESAPINMPSVCFFRRGKLIRQTTYRNLLKSKKEHIFNNYEKFKEYMLKNIYLPKMYYVNKEVLDYKISQNEEMNLYIARTGCGDCAAIDENVLYKWSTKNKSLNYEKDLYIFDLKDYYARDPAIDDPEYEEKHQKYLDYLAIKTTYGLSEAGNSTFGFDNGYVPTFQRRTGSQISDMITVLNDRVDNNFIVTSYFNEQRINNSPMLQNTGTTFLFDQKQLTADDVTEWGSVIQSLQLEWHSPIVEMFLENYVK